MLGKPEEDVPEAVCFGDLLHLRAGIGDGDETLPCFGCADDLLHAFEEILLEDVRLERAAGLARNDENRFCRGRSCDSMARICAGSVESRTNISGWPRILPKVSLQHFDAEA